MNVLEKILEEIKQYTKDVYECDLDDIVEYQRRNREDKCTYIVQGIDEAVEFIRSHMDEAKDTNVPSNDGWIPVEERLPEVPEGLADEYCPEFNVTIKGAERATTLKYSWDGTWFDDNGNVYNVIAWQPLPEPYKSKKNIPVAGMDHIMSGFTKVE